MRTRWSGLPFREFYNQHGVLVGAVLFEQSEHRREDAVSDGWTLLVNLDRHWHLAWRLYETKSAIRSLLQVGLTRGFISIMGPDNSEIGTVTLGPVNELRHPFADPPLTLQDAAGTTIGCVKRTRSGAWAPTQRAILDPDGVEVGHIKTFQGTSSVIEIDSAMPEVLRRFIFPLEDLLREWGRPKGGAAAGA
jgi:hypothetical protein